MVNLLFNFCGGEFYLFSALNPSVADPKCLSLIPDPIFFTSQNLDPGSQIPYPATTKRGEKKIKLVLTSL